MPGKLLSILPWIITVVALAALAFVSLKNPVQPVEQLRATDCWERTIKLTSSQPQSVKSLTDVADLCYLEKTHEYHLENLRIQRQTFVEQHFVGRVMLWMVVAITLSGVGLAALQLFAAFKLAVKGQGELAQEGGIELEKGKISVKSSVTGLLILVVSFAFFLVFVEKVYTIQEVRGPRAPSSAPSTAGAGVAVPMSELPAEETAAQTPAAAGDRRPSKAPQK